MGNLQITDNSLLDSLKKALAGKVLKKVLLIPPDSTRAHSYGGHITRLLFDLLGQCHIDVLPALGTHEPITEAECDSFLGIPYQTIMHHDWRNDVVKLGEIPGDFISSVTEGLYTESVDVEINKLLLDKSYDLIISIGQVVPHEVVGMANYSKNIFVGCGGSKLINASHIIGAYYGIERTLGRVDTPVRKIFDYAETNFITQLPLMYILTVTIEGELDGLYIGRDREIFEQAAALSKEKNLISLDSPINKCVVYLDENEFKSTWLGNKAIYRTRMAMADGGELIIIAPGVRRFGEDDMVDSLIRKYGYVGRDKLLGLIKDNADLQNNLCAAAHLIHGSTDGRFTVTYATKHLTKEEVEGVGFKYMPLDEAMKIYHPPPEGVYFITNPALGLWVYKGRFE